ncbi:hypothetical protein [Arcticibacter sp. MXS-1]|uniref:hypothetical protein n=1 Tax=Arcticibacter sp. MXS-1 TaxID=3341726 RepID=UPI0035A8A3E9
MRLESVLEKIGQKLNFSFSYNSNIVPRDSLVTAAFSNQPIRDILDQLLGNRYEYKEIPGYIVLRYAPHRLSLVTDKVQNNGRVYHVSGYVTDEHSGERVPLASVYERKLLRSALTSRDGSFDLKIKTRSPTIVLTASKDLYRDTTIIVLSSVKVNPDNLVDEYYYSSDSGESVAQRTVLGRLFVSYKQKIQELNVPGFIAQSPVQVSITPGLSSHGLLSGQVMNKVSLNVFGGYTAGVEGVEAGGFFNINKKSVKAAQAAGFFNLVGQSVSGVQAAGLFNGVLGRVDGVQASGLANIVGSDVVGVQAAGLANMVKGAVIGVQAGGLFNAVKSDVSGIQAAGLINVSNGDTRGVQVAGLFNTSTRAMEGAQIAGLLNIAVKKMQGAQVGLLNVARESHGFQLGLVNLADTASGVMLGLLNFARKNGVHSVGLVMNEVTARSVIIRTGTPALYSILQGGPDHFGFGLGKRWRLSNSLYLDPELASLYFYRGSWDYNNTMLRFNLNLSVKLNRVLTVFAGPAFNVLYSNQTEKIDHYELLTDKVRHFSIGKSRKVFGWAGYSAGITIF